MQSLLNSNILIGISAGIAAYKSCEIVRLLIKQGANVQVVMTENAQNFIAPITFQSLSGRPVRIKTFDPEAEAAMSHIELARWADIFIIAPASADIIAKISHGFADNLLTTIWLASKASKVVAPAMNQQMWQAAATQQNIKQLQQYGVVLIGPNSGEQACGDVGFGRMSEASEIVEQLSQISIKQQSKPLVKPSVEQQAEHSLASLKVMITAGPTVEEIDPVRFISNRSSGKMGYAIAQAAIDAGAEVTLVSGPTLLTAPDCHFYSVQSAQQMLQQVMDNINTTDIFIACAAVADYRPEQVLKQKLKKHPNNNNLVLNLIKNPDIIKQVAELAAKNTKNRPFCVAFAAETNDLKKHAQQKLNNKGVQLLAANWVGKSASGESLGFDQEQNELFLFWPGGESHLKKTTKIILAQQLIETISLIYNKKL
ncbi:MAG: bifunctional phosphopantothenoylcysteine decarboxylase/phosphopantothenate--cysteine ligase CoaBC [Pseudomonadota bacterium]